MRKKNLLYNSLKKLSEDIRVLIDLSLKESEEAWDRMMETVKRELGEKTTAEKPDEYVYRALIVEIYDHLNLLVQSLKASQDRLKRLATRDLLTGLYNRNFFNETIVRDIQKARRHHERLSMIIMDIDGFKEINDTYGHLHGDGVIKECAGLLRQSVRKSDFLCRYGGDEFVVVTPKGRCEDNGPLLERIQENLDRWNLEYSTLGYTLSLSIGCAVWEEGMDVLDVLHEADRKMYGEKERKKSKD